MYVWPLLPWYWSVSPLSSMHLLALGRIPWPIKREHLTQGRHERHMARCRHTVLTYSLYAEKDTYDRDMGAQY